MADARTTPVSFLLPPALRYGLAVLLLGGLAACAGSAEVLHENADVRYRAAIEDAETATPEEISTDLTAITPANKALIWQDAPGASRLLVVTWGDAETFSRASGDTVTTSEETWVTVVPEIRQTCRSLDRSDAALTRRLEQLLGLPPEAGYTQFAELWVDPADLFRPCPDPEITDRECERDFPRSKRFITVSDRHRQWFNRMHATMYGPDGYPWTRLGYTYDWHPATDVFGFSEFVIRAGADVIVRQVQSTEAYCQ